ncbi:hypothetical protein Tco_1225124, partial [Tanacetum coccineum]
TGRVKSAKPKADKVVKQEPEQGTTTTTTTATIITTASTRPKAKRLAIIDTDYQLAQRLQAQEQEELTDEEKARLTELVEEGSKKAEVKVIEGS